MAGMANGWRKGLVICTKHSCPWLLGSLWRARDCAIADLGDEKATRPAMLAGLTAGEKVTWQRLIDEE